MYRKDLLNKHQVIQIQNDKKLAKNYLFTITVTKWQGTSL